MKLDTLDGLNDNELQAVIARSQELLKTHDEERKAKALADARLILAAAGLSLKDIGKAKPAKTPPYKGGHLYQHPANKALVWNAKGQKPGWLRELEGQGGKPVELPEAANASLPPQIKKAV
jgi:hypothetical protein